jgi:hypothetical protein
MAPTPNSSQSARAKSQARRGTEGLIGDSSQFAIARTAEPKQGGASSLSRAQQPADTNAKTVAAKKVHVSGRFGGADVTPGVLGDDAIGVFMAGQCVAFAAEYADHVGGDVTYIYNRVRKVSTTPMSSTRRRRKRWTSAAPGTNGFSKRSTCRPKSGSTST